MRERHLAIVWVVLAVVFLGALTWLVRYGGSVRSGGAQAAAEVARLQAAIEQKQKEVLAETRTNATTLQELSWTGTTGDPVAFLSRVAELTKGSQLKVVAIGPLEQQTTPQFSKSWHALTVHGPFQELLELAARIERERGTLDNVTIEALAPPPLTAPPAGQKGPASQPRIDPGVQARFRVTALQLTQQARKAVEDAIKTSGVPLPQQQPTVALAPPAPGTASTYRNPFAFVGPVEGPRQVAGGVPSAGFELQGIVGFPGGNLAILDNQIVRAGEKMSGYTIERITDTAVLLRQPDGTARRLVLPEIGAVASKKLQAPGRPSEPSPLEPGPASYPAPDSPSGPRR